MRDALEGLVNELPGARHMNVRSLATIGAIASRQHGTAVETIPDRGGGRVALAIPASLRRDRGVRAVRRRPRAIRMRREIVDADQLGDFRIVVAQNAASASLRMPACTACSI